MNFFNLTYNLIYLAMRTPEELFPMRLCNKRIATITLWRSSTLDPKDRGRCGHNEQKIEHTDRNQAYVMVAHCHVATVPPVFRSSHAAMHVINPAASTWGKIPEQRNVLQKRKRLLISDLQKLSSRCLWHNTDSLSSTNLVSPCETAVVCNVNEALPGCVIGFYLTLLFLLSPSLGQWVCLEAVVPSFGMWGFDVVEGRGGEGRVGRRGNGYKEGVCECFKWNVNLGFFLFFFFLSFSLNKQTHTQKAPHRSQVEKVLESM